MNCPVCERENTIEKVTRTGNFPVKGKDIEVTFPMFVCRVCGIEYIGEEDPFLIAHKKYKELYGGK